MPTHFIYSFSEPYSHIFIFRNELCLGSWIWCRWSKIYPKNTTKICNSTANYPENIFGLSGGSFLKNNLIVACGGGNMLTSACYSMSNDLKWTHFANLSARKWYHASVIVNNELWVTGNFGKFKLPSISISSTHTFLCSWDAVIISWGLCVYMTNICWNFVTI